MSRILSKQFRDSLYKKFYVHILLWVDFFFHEFVQTLEHWDTWTLSFSASCRKKFQVLNMFYVGGKKKKVFLFVSLSLFCFFESAIHQDLLREIFVGNNLFTFSLSLSILYLTNMLSKLNVSPCICTFQATILPWVFLCIYSHVLEPYRFPYKHFKINWIQGGLMMIQGNKKGDFIHIGSRGRLRLLQEPWAKKKKKKSPLITLKSWKCQSYMRFLSRSAHVWMSAYVCIDTQN